MLNCILFIPFTLAVLIPLVALHTLSLLGNTSAMLELSKRYQSGFNGSFFSSDSMALHYCDEAIARGSVEAIIRKSYLLKGRQAAGWGFSDSFIGDSTSSFYKLNDWVEAFNLANRAAATGMPEGVHALREMTLFSNPHAYGDGVYLVGKTKIKARRLYREGSEGYYAYLHSSDDWKEGMRMLRAESKDTWVRDFYFIELIEERESVGNIACRKLRSAIYEYSDVMPLGMSRVQRTKMVHHSGWQAGIRMLEVDARLEDSSAADILSRAQEFSSR